MVRMKKGAEARCRRWGGRAGCFGEVFVGAARPFGRFSQADGLRSSARYVATLAESVEAAKSEFTAEST